ncbi:FtsB family cell division protein [Longirhabdus pacifica]|uniref:FtsB family cell division protein n=1 Tax=Longirhabdus pacifica TaxID=2305227 RepID=UPI0013E8C3A6|nr:septum formation initiator family protein [Longirhabdus pacifica]
MNSQRSNVASEKKYDGAKRRLRLLFVALLLFMSWAGFTLWDQYNGIKEKKAQLSALQSELSTALEENQYYLAEKEKLQDDEYMEQILHRDYHMIYPGQQLLPN